MVNYNNSKIYTIKCNTTGLIYIGSTAQKLLSNRIGTHRSSYKRYIDKKPNADYFTSFKILENNNYEYETIEFYKCNCKEELLKRELYYIELYKNKYNDKVVNKCIPYRTSENRSVYVKKYNFIYKKNNKDNLKEKREVYNEKTKEKRRNYQKEYSKSNKEQLTIQSKKYSLKKKIYRTPKITKTFIKNLKRIYRMRYNSFRISIAV